MNRLELIKEIHNLTKDKEVDQILSIKNKLLNKNFNKSYFNEWKKSKNEINDEQWHHFVRLAINFKEFEYMFSRTSYLVRRYRKNTDKYFKVKFQSGIAELPDRSSELERLFTFNEEYFVIYKKIINRINFDRIKTVSSGIIRGRINWNNTLNKTIIDFPLSFETDEWRKKFDTPENIFLIWIAIWMNHQIQRLIEKNFLDPLEFDEREKLKNISKNYEKIIRYFPFHGVLRTTQKEYNLEIESKRIQVLESQVKKRLKEGLIENTAYRELLNCFDKIKTIHFPNIEKNVRTGNFLREAVKNIDEMYEIWLFFEMLHCFAKYVDVKLVLDSESQYIQLTISHQEVKLHYEESFKENSEFAWAQKHTPDFTFIANQEVIGVLDAKNYKNPNVESPKNKILAYMTNLGTGYGAILWPLQNEEHSFPRNEHDSTKYHKNLKLALYKLDPKTVMDNSNIIQKELKKILEEIENRLKPVTECPKCNKIAIGKPEIETLFGFRKMDGVTSTQSWCKICRNL